MSKIIIVPKVPKWLENVNEKGFITILELASAIGISKTTIRRFISENKIPEPDSFSGCYNKKFWSKKVIVTWFRTNEGRNLSEG